MWKVHILTVAADRLDRDTSKLRWAALVPLLLALIAAIACGGGSSTAQATPTPQPEQAEKWELVFSKLPGALASVWGTSATDIWSVGADAGSGLGTTVLHFDGSEWKRMNTSFSGDLWWAFGFKDGPVFMGGSNGMILRYENGEFQKMETPGTDTVFGIWGIAPDNLWAVGGNATTGGFVWRYDGTSWKPAEGLPAGLADSYSIFKIFGRGNNDVWIIGTGGIAIHYDGTKFEQAPSGTTRNLFTVHSDGQRFAAVGGFGSGVIVENDGTGWKNVTPPNTPHVVGVYLSGNGFGYAAGAEGTIVRRDGSGWKLVDTGMKMIEAFHSVWVDPSGGVWAVGGQVLAPPLVDGVMIHKAP
jgi:hypothetical protein